MILKKLSSRLSVILGSSPWPFVVVVVAVVIGDFWPRMILKKLSSRLSVILGSRPWPFCRRRRRRRGRGRGRRGRRRRRRRRRRHRRFLSSNDSEETFITA